ATRRRRPPTPAVPSTSATRATRATRATGCHPRHLRPWPIVLLFRRRLGRQTTSPDLPPSSRVGPHLGGERLAIEEAWRDNIVGSVSARCRSGRARPHKDTNHVGRRWISAGGAGCHHHTSCLRSPS